MIPIIAGALFVFAGCTTSSFLGLSKAKYVEEAMNTNQSQLQEVQRSVDEAAAIDRQDIEKLEAQLEGLMGLQEQMESIITAIEETNKTNAELQTLTAELQVRVDRLSRETLRELVTVIDEYLTEAEEAEAELVSGAAEENTVDPDAATGEGSGDEATAETGVSGGE